MSENKLYPAVAGMNLNSLPSQMAEGELSFALNAVVKGMDGKSISYQTENGNTLFYDIPDTYTLIGRYQIVEKDWVVLFLAGSVSQIGILNTKTGQYTPKLSWACLNFSTQFPIHKVRHKVTSLGTEIYWPDNNTMRYLNLDNPPQVEDCNLIRVIANFNPVNIKYLKDGNEGDLLSGTYQFGFQYASATGEPFSEFSSITNPISLHNPHILSQNFDNPTGKSIEIEISNIDTSGAFDYYNVAVAKTINNITSFELIDTYRISKPVERIVYTGQTKTNIRLTADEIFEKFAHYEKAGDVTAAEDILIWSDLTTSERVNYQEIFSKLHLQWVTYKMPYKKGDNYKLPLNTAEKKEFYRDEVYAIEGAFELEDGSITDSFPIPGRVSQSSDIETITNDDVTGIQEVCENTPSGKPRWQVYNTAHSYGFTNEYLQGMGDDCYNGTYEYGEFGYHESTESYPDTDIWGSLRGTPIRHHRFPDSTVTHIHDNEGNIYPLGILLDMDQLRSILDNSSLTPAQRARIKGVKILRANRANNKSVIARGLLYNVGKYTSDDRTLYYPNYVHNDVRPDILISRAQTGDDSGSNGGLELHGFDDSESKQRFTFHSPDTHFFQPFLGNQLKLETVEYGDSLSHSVLVKGHSRYKLISRGSYAVALGVGAAVGFLSFSAGLFNVHPFDGAAAFTAFQAIITIIDKTIPRVNYTYQINSLGNYTKFAPVPNDGNKIRFVDIASYLVPGMTSAGDLHSINNFQRESSVYLRTTNTLPFTHEIGAPQDTSRNLPTKVAPTPTGTVSSYYATIKNNLANQYGRINSYQIIDTGFRFDINQPGKVSVFGGDCFIVPFALKRKMPFFTDHRVGFPDEADIDTREVRNIGYPTYWFSTDTTNDSGGNFLTGIFGQIFAVKVNNFHLRENKLFYQYGRYYAFIYGINNFFCESEVNVEYRQAYNSKEGDFYPHVGQDIPDEWLQYQNVPIEQDNTYTYNKSYSKQNKEKDFTHLPEDFTLLRDAVTRLPNSAFYSEAQVDSTIYRRNNWRIYRPLSVQHFPLTYGKLTGLNGVDNKQVLAHFESKTMLYNSLIKIDISNPKQAYSGNDKLFDAPAVDMGSSDTGYAGSQHKFFLNTEQGKIWVDSKRAQIILMQGNQVEDLASEKYKLSGFFTEFLPFKISDYFPINIDNNFMGIGLHGAYDATLNRFILTKLDYEPITPNIQYSNGVFTLNGKVINVNSTHFLNRSFTISFSFLTGSWVSFHSYLPHAFINTESHVYSTHSSSIWRHSSKDYINYYGAQNPYVLEYPVKAVSYKDDILASITDYSKVYKVSNGREVQDNQGFFNKAWLYNDEQSSGQLNLTFRDKNRMSGSYKYPVFNPTNTEILFSKNDNLYFYNSFWDIALENPFYDQNVDKIIIDEAHDYGFNRFKRPPLRGKDFKVRHILDNRSDLRIISQFIITEQQPSFK